MNRREFTASLAALAGSAILPFPALGVASRAAPAAIPPTAYAWAHLIVRAQKNASSAMLARHLQLSPEVASSLFDRLVEDGVLRAPGAAGVARAVSPLEISARSTPMQRDIVRGIADAIESSEPLVNPENIGVVCSDQEENCEDCANESPNQSAQESPGTG